MIKSHQLKPVIQTGNNLVNAIALDRSNRYKDVHLKWRGLLPDTISITPMDLCTIFSSLLNNAFEAANQTAQKKVDVTVKILESNILVTVTNPEHMEPTVIKGVYQTSKINLLCPV